MNHTCVLDSVGTELAQRAFLRAPVSISHMEISLFPCTADITQDCSVGWGASLRTLDPEYTHENKRLL